MKKIILSALVLGVAFYNTSKISFTPEGSNLTLSLLKKAKAFGDGDTDHEEGLHDDDTSNCPTRSCNDGEDEHGNDFPGETDFCTVHCTQNSHDPHYKDNGKIIETVTETIDVKVIDPVTGSYIAAPKTSTYTHCPSGTGHC